MFSKLDQIRLSFCVVWYNAVPLTFMFHLSLYPQTTTGHFSIQAATMFSGLIKNSIFIYLLSITATCVFFSFSWNLSVYLVSVHKSSTCGCHKCLPEGDQWFRKLINLSPKPFLSEINKTSEETFNWWKVNVHFFNFNFQS